MWPFTKSYCANCGKQVAGYTKFVKKNGKLLYYLCLDCEEKYKRVTNGSNHYPDTPAEVQAVIAGRDKSFKRSDSDPLESEDTRDHSADKKKDLIVLIGGILALVLGVVIGLSETIGAIFALVGIILSVMAIKAYGDDNRRVNVRFDEKTSTLFLLKRDPEVAKAVKIVADEDIQMIHEEEQLHYASATVGGITTGGFYTTGGQDYAASRGKNGFFRLEFEKHIILQIQLTDALYEQAKHSLIAGYLNEKKQIEMKQHVTLTKEEEETMMIKYQVSGWVGNEIANKGKPTKEKCKAILAWMCGNDA